MNEDKKKDIENPRDDSLNRLERLNDIENEYTSCCGSHCDKRLLQYFNKSFIIFIVLLFSIFKLLIVEDTNEKSIYINILMVILGTAINTDKISKKKD